MPDKTLSRFDGRLHGNGDNIQKPQAKLPHVKQASKAGISPSVFALGAGAQAAKIGAVPKTHFKAGV